MHKHELYINLTSLLLFKWSEFLRDTVNKKKEFLRGDSEILYLIPCCSQPASFPPFKTKEKAAHKSHYY